MNHAITDKMEVCHEVGIRYGTHKKSCEDMNNIPMIRKINGIQILNIDIYIFSIFYIFFLYSKARYSRFRIIMLCSK